MRAPLLAFVRSEGSTSATDVTTASLVVSGGSDLLCRFRVFANDDPSTTSVRVVTKQCSMPLSVIANHGRVFTAATQYGWSGNPLYEAPSIDDFTAANDEGPQPRALSENFSFTTAP